MRMKTRLAPIVCYTAQHLNVSQCYIGYRGNRSVRRRGVNRIKVQLGHCTRYAHSQMFIFRRVYFCDFLSVNTIQNSLTNLCKIVHNISSNEGLYVLKSQIVVTLLKKCVFLKIKYKPWVVYITISIFAHSLNCKRASKEHQ